MNLRDATIAQILVPADDQDRGVAFYRDVLGLPFLFTAPPAMAFFDCGGVRLLVGAAPEAPAAPRGLAIYFRVADIGAVHASLRAAGVSFLAEPHVVHRTASAQLWLAEFRDPFGNVLPLLAELAADDERHAG
jgi:methylmalonyl-CoA/ethylmalonyl-CoA epimerase